MKIAIYPLFLLSIAAVCWSAEPEANQESPIESAALGLEELMKAKVIVSSVFQIQFSRVLP